MKSIKKLALLFSFLMFMACAKEQPADNVPGGYSVRLSVRGGALSPSTYAPVAASEEEYKVSELQALFFDADGSDRYMGRKRIDMSGIAMTPSSAPDSKYDAGFTVNIDMRGVLYDSNGSVIPVKDLNGKNIKFVFVANLPEKKVAELLRPYVESGNIYTKSISDIEKLIVSSEMIADNFVMLGLGAGREPVSGTLQKSAPASLSAVELERLSAKISVSVGEVSSHPLNEGLSITKVTLKNRVKSSFLFEKGGGTESYFESREDKEYVSGYEKLYTYENSRTGVTTLSVELSFKGRPLKTVEIPFKDKAIKRNHIYRVTLNRDASDGKDGGEDDVTVNPPVINFTIDVNDWEKDYIYYQDYKNQGNAVIASITAYSEDWASPLPSESVSHEENKISDSESNLVINTLDKYNLLVRINSVSTQFEPVISEKDKDWVNIEDVTTYSQNYGMCQEFRVSLSKSQYRIGTVEFVNKINPSAKCLLHLSTRPLIPIDFVADYNLASPGMFSSTLDNELQYAYSISEGISACPKGWHVPTFSEMRAIINGEFNKYHRYVSYSTPKSFDDVEESISWSNYPIRSYLSDYRNTTSGITYALRFKNSDICCAYRYEKEGSWTLGEKESCLKVTVRYLGKNNPVTADQIANEDYWNTNSGGDVVKRFPLATTNNFTDARKIYGKEGMYVLDDLKTALIIYHHSAYIWSSIFDYGCIRPFKNSSLNKNPEVPKPLKVVDAELQDITRTDGSPALNFNYKKSIVENGNKVDISVPYNVRGTLILTMENPIDKEIWRKNFGGYSDGSSSYVPKYGNKVYLNFSTEADNASSLLSLRNSEDKILVTVSVNDDPSSVNNNALYWLPAVTYVGYTEKEAQDIRNLSSKETALLMLPEPFKFNGPSGSVKNVTERVKMGSEIKEFKSDYEYKIEKDKITIDGTRFMDDTNDKVMLFRYVFTTYHLTVYVGYAGANYKNTDLDNLPASDKKVYEMDAFGGFRFGKKIIMKDGEELLGWSVDETGISLTPVDKHELVSMYI